MRLRLRLPLSLRLLLLRMMLLLVDIDGRPDDSMSTDDVRSSGHLEGLCPGPTEKGPALRADSPPVRVRCRPFEV